MHRHLLPHQTFLGGFARSPGWGTNISVYHKVKTFWCKCISEKQSAPRASPVIHPTVTQETPNWFPALTTLPCSFVSICQLSSVPLEAFPCSQAALKQQTDATWLL